MNIFKKNRAKAYSAGDFGDDEDFKMNSGKREKQRTPKNNPNPYFENKRKWNNEIAHLNSNTRLWQILAILAMIGCIGSLTVILIVSMQTKFVPYLIEVDQHGQAIAVKAAERVNTLDERIIHAQLASFISNARMVTPDVQVQKKAIFSVYALLPPDENSNRKMNQWYKGTNESDPFKRAERITVSVNILSIVPQSVETWQIDWIETIYDRSGKLIEKFNMRALLTIFVVPPSQTLSIEQIRLNPTGLYIRDFNWAKQTQ